MPVAEYTTRINAPLADVWAWHEDVETALPSLTPPGEQVELVSAEPLPPRVGTLVTLRAKLPVLGWKPWVAEYIEHQPPEDGVALFTDLQRDGPFAAWRHRHLMEADPHHGDVTRLTDTITYTPPFGPLGKLGDVLVIRRKLDAMFRHRHAVTRDALA